MLRRVLVGRGVGGQHELQPHHSNHSLSQSYQLPVSNLEAFEPPNCTGTADHVVSFHKRAFHHFGWRTLGIGDTDSESRSEDTMST